MLNLSSTETIRIHPLISLQHIHKNFGERQVLKDISFDIADGRMTGFVGGNGAGKTTAMRILLGVLSADSGDVQFDGRAITADDRTMIGYMPEERGLYPKMKVSEQLQYFGRLHGLGRKEAADNIAELLEQLNIADRAKDKVEDLSLGNQQRVQIAAALVHRPKALVLDEPFSGLDPIAVETVLQVLRDVAAEGAPVLFSSHQLDIVDDLCDDIVLIADGQVRAAGDKEELRSQHSELRYELRLGTPGGAAGGAAGSAGGAGGPGGSGGDAAGDAAPRWVQETAGVEVESFDGSAVIFRETTDGGANELLRRAVDAGEVASFAPIKPKLSEIFKEVVQ